MFLKRKVTRFPAYLGYTVYQSEYDALKRQLVEEKQEVSKLAALLIRSQEEEYHERKSAQYWYEKYMEVKKKELGIE